MAGVLEPDRSSGSSAMLAAAAAHALADGASLRGVRQAWLRLAPGSSAFAAQAALEDALRTADFADAGRLILVRSLSLKGLPRGASGPQIARVLERAWQALAPSALAFDAPGAARAEVVYFRSVHEARLAWVQRLAAGVPADEWFWPRALPELAGPGEPGAVLAAVLALLQASAPGALAQRLQELPAPAVRRLMQALPAAAPMPLAGFVPPPAPGVEEERPAPAAAAQARAPDTVEAPAAADVPALPAAPAAPALPAAIAAAVAPWPVQDWRPRWLVALVLRACSGAPVRAQAVEQAIVAAAARTAAGSRPHAAASSGAGPAAPPPRAAASPARATPPAADKATAGPGPQADGESVPARAAGPAGAMPRAPDPPPLVPPGLARAFPWLAAGDDTAWGGLLMLLNALAILHLPAWLEHQAPVVRQHFARALLAQVAQRLRLPADDPQQPLLALPDEVQQALHQARCRWDGFAWPRGLDARGLQPAGDRTAQALACWRRALVRLLRRHAGVGLVRVVRRAANVALTPTHVDVVLPLAQADVALRRCGLDNDPGWLPWFGWIVGFHYLEGMVDDTG